MRPGDITQAMFDTDPQIVHISGHGTDAGLISFEDDIGNSHEITPAALAEVFSLFATQVKCVVLNACFSVHQAKAIARHIPYVIGMTKEIGDKAAIAFAVGFYKALAATRDVPEAFRFGLAEMKLHNIPEHATPVLIQRDALLTDFVPIASARDFDTTHASISLGKFSRTANSENWLIRTEAYPRLQNALDAIFARFLVDAGVPPHSYGDRWVLLNSFGGASWRYIIAPFNWVEHDSRIRFHDIAPRWADQSLRDVGLTPGSHWIIASEPQKLSAFSILTNSDLLLNAFNRNPKAHATLCDSAYLRRRRAAEIIASDYKHHMVLEQWADFGKEGAIFVDGEEHLTVDAFEKLRLR
jgi:hypothetical protein